MIYNDIYKTGIAFSYEPLFETMKKRGVTYMQLYLMGVSPCQINRLRNNYNMTMASLCYIMSLLDIDDFSDAVKVIELD